MILVVTNLTSTYILKHVYNPIIFLFNCAYFLTPVYKTCWFRLSNLRIVNFVIYHWQFHLTILILLIWVLRFTVLNSQHTFKQKHISCFYFTFSDSCWHRFITLNRLLILLRWTSVGFKCFAISLFTLSRNYRKVKHRRWVTCLPSKRR